MELLERVLDLLYPPKCALCHRLLDKGGVYICPRCRTSLPYTSEQGKQKIEFCEVCVSPLYYEDHAKESLLRYKFHDCRGYAQVYAPLVADCIRAAELEWDVLSWVPLSRKRLRERGFDQCFLLAEAVGKQLGTPPVSLLKKSRHTRAQSGMGGAEERRANISGAYTVPQPERVAGKTILLLDDIVTTGATLSECARTLRYAGAKAVCCASVARRRA